MITQIPDCVRHASLAAGSAPRNDGSVCIVMTVGRHRHCDCKRSKAGSNPETNYKLKEMTVRKH